MVAAYMPRAKNVTLGDESKGLIMQLLGELELQRKGEGQATPARAKSAPTAASTEKKRGTAEKKERAAMARAMEDEMTHWAQEDEEGEGGEAAQEGEQEGEGEEAAGGEAAGIEYDGCFGDMANLLAEVQALDDADSEEEEEDEEEDEEEGDDDEEEEEEPKRKEKMGKHDLKQLLKGLVKEEREGYAAARQQEREQQVMAALTQQAQGGGGKAGKKGKAAVAKVNKKVRLSLCSSKNKGQRKLVVVDRKKVQSSHGFTDTKIKDPSKTFLSHVQMCDVPLRFDCRVCRTLRAC
jgi:hypothetical protein